MRFARGAFAEALADYKQAITLNPAMGPLIADRVREAELAARRP